jgi:ethanolamine utilization protein EutN
LLRVRRGFRGAKGAPQFIIRDGKEENVLTARVVGTATATVKHASLAGWKLLVVQPFMADGRTPDGDPVIAVDAFGAGTADTVIISNDRLGTQQLLGSNTTPVLWSVIGIADACQTP